MIGLERVDRRRSFVRNESADKVQLGTSPLPCRRNHVELLGSQAVAKQTVSIPRNRPISIAILLYVPGSEILVRLPCLWLVCLEETIYSGIRGHRPNR